VRTQLPTLLDFWAFNKHPRRSRARLALGSIAASVHHHATFTRHPRVMAVARALGIGDSKTPRAARRRVTALALSDRGLGGGSGGGSDEDDDDDDEGSDWSDDEDQEALEPPAFNPRLFAFFCHVLDCVLPESEQLRAAFATSSVVHIPCEKEGDEAQGERPSAAAVAAGVELAGSATVTDAFAVIRSLTELNELHFDTTHNLIERLRPSLVPMPLGNGTFSGVALSLDMLLDHLLTLYSELEGERRARLRALFRKHDENHDGVLEYEEFRSLALDFNPHLKQRDIARLFIDVLDESEARRKRGIDGDGAADAADRGTAPSGLEDVVSAAAFAEVVDRFSVQMFMGGGRAHAAGPGSS
jgi:hypothetical protein